MCRLVLIALLLGSGLLHASDEAWDPGKYRIRLPQKKGWTGELTRQEGDPLYRLVDEETGRLLRVRIAINSLDSFEDAYLRRYEELNAPGGAHIDRQQVGQIAGLKAYTFSYRHQPAPEPGVEQVPAERHGMVIVTFANGYQYTITLEAPSAHPLEDKDLKRLLGTIAIKD